MIRCFEKCSTCIHRLKKYNNGKTFDENSYEGCDKRGFRYNPDNWCEDYERDLNE